MSGDHSQGNCKTKYVYLFHSTKCACCGKKHVDLMKYGCNVYCPACFQERIIDHGKKDWIKAKKHMAQRKGYNPHV